MTGHFEVRGQVFKRLCENCFNGHDRPCDESYVGAGNCMCPCQTYAMCKNCEHERGLHELQATNDVCNGPNRAWNGSCQCPGFQGLTWDDMPPIGPGPVLPRNNLEAKE